jgi:hypothetical protein
MAVRLAPSRSRHTATHLTATAALVLLIAAGAFTRVAIPRTALAAQFSSGDIVRVVDGSLNLRLEPGLDALILRVLPDGCVLTVTDGPVSADGYAWYRVSSDAYGTGWAAAEFMAPA